MPPSEGRRPGLARRHPDPIDARRWPPPQRWPKRELAGAGAKMKASGGSGHRGLHQRVKTARRRKPSSQRWLERQLNDPYVARSKDEGYRARSAYKLIEIDDRFHI